MLAASTDRDDQHALRLLGNQHDGLGVWLLGVPPAFGVDESGVVRIAGGVVGEFQVAGL